MDFEFDKEIDALLRQSAQGETALAAANPKSQIPNPKSVHLDADEISAFAENALPEKTKQKYTLHLADCDGCRKSLSSLIALDSETENTAAQAEEKHFIHAPLPWYHKLFAFPNPAYTMGALVLVFSGIAAYTVLQSVNRSQNTEVSQISERQPNGKGMSSDGEQQAAIESYSSNTMMSNANMMMSNAAAMNSASNSAANFSAMPAAPNLTANSNAATLRETEADKNLKAETKPLPPPKEPVDSAKTDDSTTSGAPPAKENELQTDGAKQKQQNQAQGSIMNNQTNVTPDSRDVQRAPMPTTRAENKSKKLESLRDDAAEKSTSETSVGGRTFKRENNVWYDSAYRGQATANFTRGTKEYKKLDSGLRGIADNLGGTVVIVWKQKAYRIQ